MEYKIIANNRWEELQKAVQERLDNGWSLQGGVAASLSENDEYCYNLYAQAVVREKP